MMMMLMTMIMVMMMTMRTTNDDNDDDAEDNHLAVDNGKGVNPDPPSTIFKLDRMVEQHP